MLSLPLDLLRPRRGAGPITVKRYVAELDGRLFNVVDTDHDEIVCYGLSEVSVLTILNMLNSD